MENRKIIAREVAPEDTDFSFYFDGDCFSRRAGDRCYEIYIPGSRRVGGYNEDEYKDVLNDVENILCEYSNGENSITRALEYALSYEEAQRLTMNTHKLHALKEWAKGADSSAPESVAEYLSILTGKKWDVRSFHGYSQGDYCDVVYCADRYSEDSITEIGKMWLGCGSEFGIGTADENGDEDLCYGYFVTDHDRWDEGEIMVKKLAAMYGCKPEELEIYLYDGEVRAAKYKKMEIA